MQSTRCGAAKAERGLCAAQMSDAVIGAPWEQWRPLGILTSLSLFTREACRA